MEKTQTRHSEPKLKILRSADPKTAFGQMSPAEIIEKHGLPNFLLGSSLKTKIRKVLDVELVNVLFPQGQGRVAPGRWMRRAACSPGPNTGRRRRRS